MLFMAIAEYAQYITSTGSVCIHHYISCTLLFRLWHYLWVWYAFGALLPLYLLNLFILIISYRYMTQV